MYAIHSLEEKLEICVVSRIKRQVATLVSVDQLKRSFTAQTLA